MSKPNTPNDLKNNRIEIRLPFGNLACRYMMNGIAYFNPHIDSNYIMSFSQYIVFFFKYLIKTQPFILWSWFWGACATLIQSLLDRLRPELKDPLTMEDRIEDIAFKSNANPRMVRELKEISVPPAASFPLIVLRELWLDRAFLFLIGLFASFQIYSILKITLNISFWWILIPIVIFLLFFLFYNASVSSSVSKYKEPKEQIMNLSQRITRARRVVYGHTHILMHKNIAGVEHLNAGTWSPAFTDIECTESILQRGYVWIEQTLLDERRAQLFVYQNDTEIPVQV